MPASPPSTSAPPSSPNATAKTTEAIERVRRSGRGRAARVRRKSRSPAQRARAGAATIAPIRNQGVVSATSCAVPVPKIGCTRTTLSRSVSSARPRPRSRLKASPAWRCARSTVRRWTSALPTPSLGTFTASSCTMTATANMPKALGGISRASTTIEATSSSSVAIRASVIHRSPEAVFSVSSSFVLASLTGASNADPAPALPPRRASPAGRRALVRWSMTTTTYLLERKRLLVAIVCGCLLVGLAAARLNVGAAPACSISAAVTNVRVDTPAPSIEDRKALPQDLSTLVKHAELLARTAVTPPVLDRAAAIAGIPKDKLAGVGRMTAFVPLSLTEPNSEQRASEIDWSNHQYRVEAQASPTTPTMEVYAQAPTTEEAQRTRGRGRHRAPRLRRRPRRQAGTARRRTWSRSSSSPPRAGASSTVARRRRSSA